MSGRWGFPTALTAVARNPMAQVWARGSGSQWTAAAQAQCFSGKLRGRWEEWRECDKAGGGFSKGMSREKEGVWEARSAPFHCLAVSPCWRQVWDLQLKQQGTAALRDVPVTLMDEADTLTRVLSPIPDGRNMGHCAASSLSSWPPGTSEIARLCGHYPCISRWLVPSKGKRQWKSLSCCGYSCEDRTDLQDDTAEGFFNGDLLVFEKMEQCNSTAQKEAQRITSGYAGKLLSCAGWPGCSWVLRAEQPQQWPSLHIRFGVTFLAPALTQVSAHSYQQDLQVALHVFPLGIEIFLNSEHP